MLRKNGVQPSITYSAEPAARVRANKAVPRHSVPKTLCLLGSPCREHLDSDPIQMRKKPKRRETWDPTSRGFSWDVVT